MQTCLITKCKQFLKHIANMSYDIVQTILISCLSVHDYVGSRAAYTPKKGPVSCLINSKLILNLTWATNVAVQ